MGANVGYLMATPSASDAVTVRFSKSSSALPVYEESAEEGKSILLKQHNLKTLVGGRPHFTYKENMGWNLFGVPYLCSYTTERMSIDHILYTYDPEASRFVSINSLGRKHDCSFLGGIHADCYGEGIGGTSVCQACYPVEYVADSSRCTVENFGE